MGHYAKVVNKEVVQVIVAEDDFMANDFVDTSAGEWIKCSYNTRKGVHLLGGTPLRYNYPNIGWKYDAEADAFYPEKPYPSWTLNTTTYVYDAPVAHPNVGSFYEWNEETQAWDELT